MPPESSSETGELLVHIVLQPEARVSQDSLAAAVKLLNEVGGLRELNERRLARYGIASGWVRRDSIAALKALSIVASVSIDDVQGTQ